MAISDFALAPPDLEVPVEAIVKHAGSLTAGQRTRILSALSSSAARGSTGPGDQGSPGPAGQGNIYGADFDLRGEVEAQLNAVRALRDEVIDSDGALKAGIPVRDAREAITASTNQFQMLMKFHERIVNMARMRAVEQATVDALKNASTEVHEQFLRRLRELLDST